MTVPPPVKETEPDPGNHRRIMAIIVLAVLGVGLSVLSYRAVSREHTHTVAARLASAADDRAAAIRHALEDNLHELPLIAHFLATAGLPDRAAFAQLVQPMLRRHPQMQAIGWNSVIHRDERADFELAMRAEGFEDFSIRERDASGALVPAADRERYLPVRLIEPLKSNDDALGFDIASEPVRRLAASVASETGQATMTARIRLVQETGHQWGALALQPVHRPARGPGPPELVGFITIVFRYGDTVKAALEPLGPGGLDLLLLDAGAEPGARFLHRHWSRTRSGLGQASLAQGPQELAADPELQAFRFKHSFALAGRRWEVWSQPTATALAGYSSNLPQIVLGSGLGFTALLVSYLLSLTRFTRHLTDEAEQRQVAYKALADSHRSRDTLLSNLPGYAYRCHNDPDWTLDFISEGVEETTGYSVREYLVDRSITCGEKTHPDDRERVWQQVQDALDRRQPFETEYRIHHKSGEVRWMWERGRGIHGPDGQLQFIEGFVADVTEKQVALASLAQSEQRLRSLVESAPVCIHEINLDGSILSMNSAGLRMCGLTDENEIRGKPYLESVDEIDRRHVSVLLEKARRGVPSRFEFRAAGTPEPAIFASCFIPIPGPSGQPARIMGMTEEITHRRQAQKQLARSEAQFRNLVESSPDAVFVESADGIVLAVNEAACHLHGMNEDELVGQHVLDLVPPDHRDLVRRDFPKVATGEMTDFQGYSLHRDGTAVPVSVRANRIEYQDQTAVLLHVRDVTAEKAAAARVAESEHRYRTLLEHAPEAVLVMDIDAGRLIETNRGAEEMFKLSRDQILQRQPWELSPPYQPDGRESEAAAQAMIEQAIQGATPIFQWTHRDSEGEDVPCEIRLVRMTAGGRTLVRGSLIDLRPRQAVEATVTSLGRIVEDSLNEIYVFDAQTLKFVEVNRGARENLGYSMDELRNLTPLDLKPLIDPPDFARLLAPLRHQQPQTNRFETVHRRKNGSTYPVDVHLQASSFRGSDVFVAIALDTTARTRAEHARRVKTEQLSAVGHAMTEFLRTGNWREASAGILSHALKQTDSVYGFVGVLSTAGKLRVLAHEGIRWDRHRGRELYEGAVQAYQTQGYLEFDSLDNLFGRVITQKQAVVANEPARDQRRSAGGLPEGHPPLDAFMGVPLFSGEDVVGMIGVANRPEGYTAEDQHKLEVLCQATGVLYDSYRRQQKEQQLLNERTAAQQALQKTHDQLEHRVAERTRQLRALALKVSQAEQDERRRVATGLHDNIGQLLAAAKIGLGALTSDITNPDVRTVAQDVSNLVDQCIQFTRSLTFELSPPALYELGLEPAVESLAGRISKQHALQITVDDDGEPKPLNDDVRVFLFQAVRELLLNAVKHAQAEGVQVIFGRDNGNIEVRIEDDGVGIRPEFLGRPDQPRSDLSGYGLFNIRERLSHLGGFMTLDSRDRGGTRVRLVAPLDLPSHRGDDDNAPASPSPQVSTSAESSQDTPIS